MHLCKLNKFPNSFNPKHIKMKFQLFTLLKSIQIFIIVIILWRVFSQLEICGRFLQTKAILRYGIDGTCQQLFFYLPPNPNENLNESSSIRLPRLRLWWSYDAQNFLPPKPDKLELNQMTELIKEQMVNSAKLVDSENIRVPREMNSGNEGEDEMRSEFSRMKMTAILPEEEEQPEELLELDKYARESEEATNSKDSESILVKMGKIEKGMPKKREKREMDDELPWLKMKKSAILPHEETKYSKQEKRQKDESENWQNIDHKFYCFELLNMQEYAMDPENRGWASPLVILGNRSVATIAIGFSHLLLLFAQVYLLNCLEVDNLEQRRGKLFLELLIILISFLGWLVIVLLKIRTELHWEMMWMCTNFRPEIFKMIVFVQIFASTLMLLALFEGLYIFTKMRKCSKMIKIERENDLKPQRPSI